MITPPLWAGGSPLSPCVWRGAQGFAQPPSLMVPPELGPARGQAEAGCWARPG